MTAHTQTIAFRLWAYATPRGWDCTVTEAADALDVSLRALMGAIRVKGWGERFRTTQSHSIDLTYQSGMVSDFDGAVQQ